MNHGRLTLGFSIVISILRGIGGAFAAFSLFFFDPCSTAAAGGTDWMDLMYWSLLCIAGCGGGALGSFDSSLGCTGSGRFDLEMSTVVVTLASLGGLGMGGTTVTDDFVSSSDSTGFRVDAFLLRLEQHTATAATMTRSRTIAKVPPAPLKAYGLGHL